MSTEFFNDQWRIPSNENQNKISNYSMDFDGSVDFVQIGPYPNNVFLQRSEAELNATGYSVSAWIKIDSSFVNQGGIFANDGIPQSSIIYGLEFRINSNRTLRIDKGDGTGRFGANLRAALTVETVPLDAWTHVVFVLPSANETTWQIYINGIASTMTTGGTGGAVSYSGIYYGGIGRIRNFLYFFQGKIDQVSIFDYALSQDQVTQLHNPGYAFNFIPNDYVNCGDSNDFSFGNVTTDSPFSISAWINMDDATRFRIASKFDSSSNSEYIFTVGGSDLLTVNLYDNSENAYIGKKYNTALTSYQGQWIHVVATYDGTSSSSGIKLYLNSSEVDDIDNNSGSYIAMENTTQPLYIGRQGNDYANGEMSNVSILNTELTGPQVATLYNNGKPLADMSSFTSLQGWWKLDDTATFNSGTSVWSIPDDSTNSNTGTSVGMNASNLVASNINGELIANPMITSPKPIAYYQLGDQSVDNGAKYLVPNNSLSDYVFDFPPNDHVAIGNSTDFNFGTGDFTISFWINFNNFTPFQYLFDFRDSNLTSENVLIMYMKPSLNRIVVMGAGSVALSGNSGTALSSGVWNNVIIKRTNNIITSHINGANADQTSGVFSMDFNTTPKLNIGANGNGVNGVNGKMSNFQIFNTALPQTGSNSIEAIYNNGSPLTSMSGFNSLQAWYKLNSSEIFNSTSTEWSVDNNAYPSVYQSSLNFNGSGNYIDCGDSDDLSFGNSSTDSPFSISMWGNITNGVNFRGVQKISGSIYEYRFNTLTNGVVRLNLYDANNVNFIGVDGGSLTSYAGQWIHLVATYDGSSSSAGCKIYLNGSPLSTTPSEFGNYTAMHNTTAPVEIGRLITTYTDGKISNAAIFNAELTGPQVQTIYNNGTPEASISHSPVSWWKLDNTTTGLIDNGSASNNGTNNGATEYAGFVNALGGESVGMDSSNLVVSDLQQTSGYSPYALDFDGADDYLDTPQINLGSTNTISFWINNSATNIGTIFGDPNAFGSPPYALVQDTSAGNLTFRLGNNDAGYWRLAVSSGLLSDGNWHHHCLSRNGVTINYYIDGTLQTNVTNNTLNASAGTNTTIEHIMANTTLASFASGKLSNVALWDTDLSSTEVTEIYNQGVPSNLNTFSGTAPVAWWQIGSNSSFNPNPTGTEGAWTCLDEIGTNNAESSNNMTNDDIVDGPGYSASGLGTSSIDIVGDAPYSTANGLSENMDVLDRTTDVPS